MQQNASNYSILSESVCVPVFNQRQLGDKTKTQNDFPDASNTQKYGLIVYKRSNSVLTIHKIVIENKCVCVVKFSIKSNLCKNYGRYSSGGWMRCQAHCTTSGRVCVCVCVYECVCVISWQKCNLYKWLHEHFDQTTNRGISMHSHSMA